VYAAKPMIKTSRNLTVVLMIKGFLPSSMRTESTSSIIAKLKGLGLSARQNGNY
jgi:hypothetical protein